MAYYDKSVDFTESASNQLLTDITYASPIGFRLLIDSQRYPNAQFSIQTASIPEITVDAAAYATPQRTVEIAGDKVSYSPFSCTFIVDEQLENYYEIHEWLNNVSREIQFVDAYPTSLSTLDFDAKNTNVEYLVGDVTFNYSYFKVR